jgi:hypothetical protein
MAGDLIQFDRKDFRIEKCLSRAAKHRALPRRVAQLLMRVWISRWRVAAVSFESEKGSPPALHSSKLLLKVFKREQTRYYRYLTISGAGDCQFN